MAIIVSLDVMQWPADDNQRQAFQAAGAAIGLTLALGLASVLKSNLLSRLLGAPVQGWRWSLIWAAAAAIIVGYGFTTLPRSFEWVELALGIPLILRHVRPCRLDARLHQRGPCPVPTSRRRGTDPASAGSVNSGENLRK